MNEQQYPHTILFIEDETAIRQNYVAYLKMYFQEVYEASNAEDGYSIYKNKKPDILIVDIHLPKLSGIDLIKQIRENDYDIKIIILTAHADTKFLLDAIPLQLTKYLIKPINRQNLKESLQLAVMELKTYTISSNKRVKLTNDYAWDVELKELRYHNQNIELTAKERSFLELLVSRKNKIFTYDEIFDFVWGYNEIGTLNGLKNLVRRLRKKIPENTIINLFNEGYKINF